VTRLSALLLLVAVSLASGGCAAHPNRAHTVAPARPLTTAPHASVAPVETAPAPVTSSVSPLAVKGGSAVATCEEPCPDCTPLTDSEDPVVYSRTLTTSEKALLVDLFHNYLLSADCLADPDHVELSQLGKSVRDISGDKAVVDGSFTEAGRHQTLVLFFMGNCGTLGFHADNYGTSVFVLFDGGKITMVTEYGPTRAIELLPVDLENDGITELVTIDADYASGATFSSADVWSFANGMKELAHFDLSYRSCLGDEPQYYESSLLTGLDPKTKRLCFLQRRREEQCPPRPAGP
jgi:hypothetical protein